MHLSFNSLQEPSLFPLLILRFTVIVFENKQQKTRRGFGNFDLTKKVTLIFIEVRKTAKLNIKMIRDTLGDFNALIRE
jgi:hypothetical protein